MPDDELFKLAEKNQLRAHQDEQVRRMLKDPKARALTENFAEQWLHLGGAQDRRLPIRNCFPTLTNRCARPCARKPSDLSST